MRCLRNRSSDHEALKMKWNKRARDREQDRGLHKHMIIAAENCRDECTEALKMIFNLKSDEQLGEAANGAARGGGGAASSNPSRDAAAPARTGAGLSKVERVRREGGGGLREGVIPSGSTRRSESPALLVTVLRYGAGLVLQRFAETHLDIGYERRTSSNPTLADVLRAANDLVAAGLIEDYSLRRRAGRDLLRRALHHLRRRHHLQSRG